MPFDLFASVRLAQQNSSGFPRAKSGCLDSACEVNFNRSKRFEWFFTRISRKEAWKITWICLTVLWRLSTRYFFSSKVWFSWTWELRARVRNQLECEHLTTFILSSLCRSFGLHKLNLHKEHAMNHDDASHIRTLSILIYPCILTKKRISLF